MGRDNYQHITDTLIELLDDVDQTTLEASPGDFEPLDAEQVEHIDAFIDHTGAEIEHDHAAAAYLPPEDVIRLPA